MTTARQLADAYRARAELAHESIGCDIDGPAILPNDAAAFSLVAGSFARVAAGRSTVAGEIAEIQADRRAALASGDADAAAAMFSASVLLTPHAEKGA